MRAHPLAAVALAAAAVLAGCTSDGRQGAPTPTSAAPSPTWELRPVKGERIPTVYEVSSSEVLGRGEPAQPDEEAIDALTGAIGDFLDDHLDRLQRDGQGRLGTVASKPFRARLAATDAGEVATRDLASPAAPVKTARYHIAVYHDGAPEWASVIVEVTHPDGSAAAATLVFVPAEDGSLSLTLVGPEDRGQR